MIGILRREAGHERSYEALAKAAAALDDLEMRRVKTLATPECEFRQHSAVRLLWEGHMKKLSFRHTRRAGYRCSGTCQDHLLVLPVVRICAHEVKCVASQERGNVRGRLLLVLKDLSVHRYLVWYDPTRKQQLSTASEFQQTTPHGPIFSLVVAGIVVKELEKNVADARKERRHE